MENVSRSINRNHSSASISKKVIGGSGFASKSLYNDVYGGIPKFGTLAFSPSVEDYAEIFGTFRAFRASSIPMLDLPFVHEADATFDFQSSCFNYSDVFGASNSLNFAASYEELFKMSEPGADDDSSDEVWTPAQSELCDVSEAHIYNTNAEKSWTVDLHQSINTIPSSCNPQKDMQKEHFSNLQTHVSHFQSLSGMPIVDNQTHVLQNKYEHPCMSKSTEDSNTCNNVIRQADAPKFFRKTHSLPINSGEGNGKTIGNSNHATYFKRKPQDVYEQSLGISASVVPPQSSLLPELLDMGNQETCDPSSHHIISTNHIPQTIPGYDLPALYDTEVNASLFAATSAASIKEVMKKAQTKLRNAKKIMEKRKEVLQNCLRLELDTNAKSVEEEKPEFHAHSNFSDKNMADTCAIKRNELRSFPPREDKKSMISSGNDIPEKVRYFNLSELSTSKNPGQRSSIKKHQCCQRVDESSEESDLCEHEGENSLGDALEKFDNEKFDNEKYRTVNKCKYGTKIFVEEPKMSEENDSRRSNENITTIEMEEGNHACVFSEVTDREIVKILEDQILPADEEKRLILTAPNLTNDNKLPETGKNDTVSSEEQKFKMVFELECCREVEKMANETWTRKNNDFELKIKKIKSAVNESFKGTLSRPSKTREDNEIDKSIKIPLSSRGKQIPIIENEDNKKLMVGFKIGKNNKLQENDDSQSMYQHNLVKIKEYDRIEDVMNIDDGCLVHEGNEVEKIMEEAWVIAVKNEELENTEGVFELGENQEKCKRYMWHDAKVGLLHHQPFCARVQHQNNGVHFLQSYENHVCLDLKCDKIIDETSHEEVGRNVIEILVTKKLEQDIDVPGVRLGISDDAEGNTSWNCNQTWSTELVLGESSRPLDISRTDIFVRGSLASLPHNENKENLDDALHVVSGGRNVSASEEDGKVVGEAIKSKLFLNMEITKGIQNQRIMGIGKMVQNVNNTYENMQMNCNSQNIVAKGNNSESMNRRKEMGSDHRREAEEMERETEHKKDMIDVEITCEAKEKIQHDIYSASGAYLHTDSIKFGEKAEKLSPGEKQYTVEFQSVGGVTTEARGRDGELKISDKSTCKAQERAKIAVRSGGDESRSDGIRSTTSFNGRGYSSGFRNQNASNYTAVGSESSRRHQARLERHLRTIERVGKALKEKNRRDLIVQQEKAERCRLAESLDADVKRWSNGKEGNLRALLSTLQYILGGESGWKAVALTEVITSVGVKKAYRKATLCVHPDKLQQRGANIHDKYISEKVFDLLKEAWNRFNSEER